MQKDYVNAITLLKNVAGFITLQLSLEEIKLLSFVYGCLILFWKWLVENVQDFNHFIRTKYNDIPDNYTVSKTIWDAPAQMFSRILLIVAETQAPIMAAN